MENYRGLAQRAMTNGYLDDVIGLLLMTLFNELASNVSSIVGMGLNQLIQQAQLAVPMRHRLASDYVADLLRR